MFRVFRVCSLIFILLLLAFPSLAFKGASYGLTLWFSTMLPTLLPFMIASSLLVGLKVPLLFERLVRLLPARLRFNGAYLTAIGVGFFCGYPVGAKMSRDLYQEGLIDDRECCFLAAFCNLPSPMFLVGYIAVPHILPSVYLSAALVAVCARFVYLPSQKRLAAAEYRQTKRKAVPPSPSLMETMENSITQSLILIAKIGGYMILFSIFAVWILVLTERQPLIQAVCSAILEMTTGISYIKRLSLPGSLGSVLCAQAAAFGGLCSMAQTKSVIADSPVSIAHYGLWKLLHMTLCGLLMYLFSL